MSTLCSCLSCVTVLLSNNVSLHFSAFSLVVKSRALQKLKLIKNAWENLDLMSREIYPLSRKGMEVHCICVCDIFYEICEIGDCSCLYPLQYWTICKVIRIHFIHISGKSCRVNPEYKIIRFANCAVKLKTQKCHNMKRFELLNDVMLYLKGNGVTMKNILLRSKVKT